MKRWCVLGFGVVSYAMFLGVFLYTAGFVGGFLVPTRLDGPLEAPLREAVVVNLLLLLAFAVQHSLMARPAFKSWWTRLVPQPLERSSYVLATNLVLVLLFWQWRPLGGVVWDVQQPAGRVAVWLLFALGWMTVLVATVLINHLDLFGLRQVWLYFCGRAYTDLPFVTPGPYRFVRHPLYIGWLLAFWSTPTMTMAHLFFALGMTAYILAAIRLEERDLVRCHAGYAEYRRRVPMLIPRFRLAQLPRAAHSRQPENVPVGAHAME